MCVGGGAAQGSEFIEPASPASPGSMSRLGGTPPSGDDRDRAWLGLQVDADALDGSDGEAEDHDEHESILDQDEPSDTEGENVRVLVRVRPFSDDELALRTQACTTVGPRTLRLPGRYQSEQYSFHFDRVFDTDADQQSLYEGARLCRRKTSRAT